MPDPYPDITAAALADLGLAACMKDRQYLETTIAYNYSTGAAGTFPALTTKYGEIRAEAECDRLWLLSATAESTLGALQVNGAVNPPSSVPWGGTPPAANAITQTSLLAMQVVASGTRGTVRFLMDLTAPPIELWARTVTAWIMAPADSQEITPSNPTPTNAGNLGNSEKCGLSIIGLRTSRGNIETRRTVPIRVTANTQGQILVPPYARDVTIYQDNLGNAALLWEMYYGRAAGPGMLAGPIPFRPGLRIGQADIHTPKIQTIASDTDVQNDRFFSAVFRIRPP